ncbi:hypothetical protein TrVGV298_006754 [Trichoderma virens]|nr:hypothetical protein TrVGV298_006754 [Trichoderma virens]
MSGYYQPPPLPPRYGNGSIPPPTPPRQASGQPAPTYGGNAQYPYGNVSPQQQTQYGYQTAPPPASPYPNTAAPAPYFPPPPGPPPPGHSGYPYTPPSTAPGSVTTAPPQSPSQAYPLPQSPSYSYHPPPQNSPQSYPPPPPPLPPRAPVQQNLPSYSPYPPYNPAQNAQNTASHTYSPPQQASYYNSPPHAAPYTPASHAPTPAAPVQTSAYQYTLPAAAQPPSLPVASPQSPAPGGYAISNGTVIPLPQQQAAYTASSPPPPPMSTRPPARETSNNYAPQPPVAPTALGEQLPAGLEHPPPPPLPPSDTASNQHQYPRRPVAAPNTQQTVVPASDPTPAYPAAPQTYQIHSDRISPIQPTNNATPIPPPPPAEAQQTYQIQPHNIPLVQPTNNVMPISPPPAEVQQPTPVPTTVQSQDPMANLYTQMTNLNMNPVDHNVAHQPSVRALHDDAPRPPPLIRATGQPLEVVTYCPETRAVDYSLYWYRLPDLPDLLICTRCHADHIQSTQLASKFEKIKRPDNFNSMCCFWFPRVKEVIWPQAVRTGNMDALHEFLKKRLNVKTCKGRNSTTASNGIKWFGMTGNEINGFISCEACYEDRIAGTPFETRFSPYREQPTNEQWSCDIATPFISRVVVKKAKEDDWAGFVSLATHRLSLPKCEGRDIQSNDCTWYMPRIKIENMRACEACYLDRVGFTRFEKEFEKYVMPPGFDSYFEHMTQFWSCKLNETNLPLVWALENAIEQRNWSVFSSSAEVACRLPPCTKNGIIRGNWWTVQGGCDNFDVCETCYVSVLRTSGVAQFFEPVQRNPEATLVCDFCVSSPRFRQYLRKYAQSVDLGVFSYYLDYVRTFASVPVCPGLDVVEKGHWWGYPNALFCQDCYLSFVTDTKLGDSVVLKKAYDERAQICQIWSSRMRTMWLKVCDAGPPGSPESEEKLAEFIEFGGKRLKIYTQTVPQMKFIREMKLMKMQNAMHQGLLSVMYNGMDGLASISGTTDGHLHGNSQLGWYETEQGAQGAQMFNNMQAGFASANRADEWMQIFQLERIWKEVE